MMHAGDCTLVILAGGAGSRMGFPKSHLRLRGQPILEYLHARFQWPGPTMLVTAPGIGDTPGASLFSCIVSDPVAGLGPLRGVLTALENATTQLICVATVDMPFVTPEMLDFLNSALWSDQDLLGILCRDSNAKAGRIEPFPSAFRVNAKESIKAVLEDGGRSVHRLTDDRSFIAIDLPAGTPPKVWTNLNRPEDLAPFEAEDGDW